MKEEQNNTEKKETTERKKETRGIFYLFFLYFQLRFKRFRKKFDIEKISYDKLSEPQKKAVNIASVCIFNKKSKLYYNPKDGFIQIELPEVFITVVHDGGNYEVAFVYVGQPVETIDKVSFDSSSINHIYTKFEREVQIRMDNNIKRKEVVFNSHLDILSDAVKNLSLNN